MKKLQINIFRFFTNNLNATQQIMLLENLVALLKNGFTLLECFEFLNLYFKYKDKNLGRKIIENIKAGQTCYDILSLIGYSNSVTTQIYFAQQYGNIEDSLIEAIKYLKTNLNAKKRIIKAIQYPSILICIFLGMIIVLNYTVLPQFKELYSTMDIELSLFQKILTQFISSLPIFILLTFLLLIFLSLLLFLIQSHYPISKKQILLSKLPIFNTYYKILKTYQISNDLSLFYKNGISLQDIVQIYNSQTKNPFLKYLGGNLLESINNGVGLADSLEKFPCFQKDLIKFVKQGEKSGKLDVELKLYSHIIINRFQEKALRHTKIIQPIIFVCLGIFIISLYMIIMLPMFQLMQNIN